MSKPLLNIVLHRPDIPGNTGSIGRTCVALGARLILIKPYGFEITQKALRRVGLTTGNTLTCVNTIHLKIFMKQKNQRMSPCTFLAAFLKSHFTKANLIASAI